MFAIQLHDPEETPNAVAALAPIGLTPFSENWKIGLLIFQGDRQQMEAASGRLSYKGILHVAENTKEA